MEVFVFGIAGFAAAGGGEGCADVEEVCVCEGGGDVSAEEDEGDCDGLETW